MPVKEKINQDEEEIKKYLVEPEEEEEKKAADQRKGFRGANLINKAAEQQRRGGLLSLDTEEKQKQVKERYHVPQIDEADEEEEPVSPSRRHGQAYSDGDSAV